MHRLPLKGHWDLTYRCNNRCRHCWIYQDKEGKVVAQELGFEEIRRIADQARALGCNQWILSGGEPLIRPDFAEIFDYLTRQCVQFTLNTNGTLLTPAIVRLLLRPGQTLVSIYGATAAVHDHITQTPGSFEAAWRGVAYLQEARARYFLQIVPMRDNLHELEAMIKLAQDRGAAYRLGASWLRCSGPGHEERNRTIADQRLSPEALLHLDPPEAQPLIEEWEIEMAAAGHSGSSEAATRMDASNQPQPEPVGFSYAAYRLSECAGHQNGFHIDPWGGLSFCGYLHEPRWRFSLRQATFQTGWDQFLPALAARIAAEIPADHQCQSCPDRRLCHWCPVYAYLEHGRYDRSIDYLCRVTQATKDYLAKYQQQHRRRYQIAGFTVDVTADIPLSDEMFDPVLERFRTLTSHGERICLHHHFRLPPMASEPLGELVYQKAPWTIWRCGQAWIYRNAPADEAVSAATQLVVFNDAHDRARIYHDHERTFWEHCRRSLAGLGSDQIWLAAMLARRQGCLFHAASMVREGQGLMFLGHSGAGKSTILSLLPGADAILSDDRVIVRRWPAGFKLHSTWNQITSRLIEPDAAPLRAIFFLEKSRANRATRLSVSSRLVSDLMSMVIRPLATAAWWQHTFDLVEALGRQVPVYRLEFTKVGGVADCLHRMAGEWTATHPIVDKPSVGNPL